LTFVGFGVVVVTVEECFTPPCHLREGADVYFNTSLLAFFLRIKIVSVPTTSAIPKSFTFVSTTTPEPTNVNDLGTADVVGTETIFIRRKNARRLVLKLQSNVKKCVTKYTNLFVEQMATHTLMIVS
jgi:hypothetical protein